MGVDVSVLTEEPKRSKVGAALELAGMLLRRGDLSGARHVLSEIRYEVALMMVHEPRPKPEQEEESPKSPAPD